jgi:serine/threonine protein kinase
MPVVNKTLQEVLQSADDTGRTPLLSLCSSPYISVAELNIFRLFGVEQFKETDKEQMSAMHILCSNPNLSADVLKLAMQNDVIPFEKGSSTSRSGSTMMHCLAQWKTPSLDLLCTVLNSTKPPCAYSQLQSVPDTSNNLPIHYLARAPIASFSLRELEKVCAAHTAALLALPNGDGLSVAELLYETHQGDPDLARVLRDLFLRDSAAWMKYKSTAAFFRELVAAPMRELSFLTSLRKHLELLKVEGVETMVMSFALCFIVMMSHQRDQLLAGARSTDDRLTTLLKVCSESAKDPQGRTLLTLKDEQGRTLLHHAAKMGSKDLCVALINAGAGVHVVDAKGVKPVKYCTIEHRDCLEYLEKLSHQMFRDRFEQTERKPLPVKNGKIAFALDYGEPVNAESSEGSVVEDSGPVREGKHVALKFFNTDDHAHAEFEDEAKLHKKLSELANGAFLPPWVATFQPVPNAPEDSDDSLYCLVMESGDSSIRQLIDDSPKTPSGRMQPWEQASVIQVAMHTVRAFKWLHSLNYVHLDIKAENIVCFGRVWKMIDVGSAMKVGEVLPAGRFTAHYAPPEQASRALKQRMRDAASVSVVPTPPEMRVDPSYDVWSLGCVLFLLRTGEFPFDISLGVCYSDETAETTAILQAIANSSDAELEERLKKYAGGRIGMTKGETSLLRHMLTRNPDDRYTMEKCEQELTQLLKQATSSTQREGAMDQVISRVDANLGSISKDVKSGTKVMNQLGANQQEALQQGKQIKAALNQVAQGVNLVLEHQLSMSSELTLALDGISRLETSAQRTLKAVFAVNYTTIPRLFTLLPDIIDAQRRPLSVEEARSLKQQFLSFCSNSADSVEKVRRRMSPFSYYRLKFLCEATHHAGPCSEHPGFVVSEPEKYLKKMLPVLRVANGLLQTAAVVGRALVSSDAQ